MEIENRMIKNIFLDLDGTLLSMDLKSFLNLYFKSITQAICPYYKIHPLTLKESILKGMDAMYENDGGMTNKMKFWSRAATVAGMDILNHTELFESYYENEFIYTKSATNQNPYASKIVEELKGKGYTVVLATNPIFPKKATERRIKWAGLNKEDFKVITTYETSKFCKPSKGYFEEICRMANCNPEETLMVGNDVIEDMSAERAGLSTYLVTDDLINREKADCSKYQQGSLKEFYEYCLTLPDLNK